MINNYDGFIFDLDGTIYLEEKIIPEADKVINIIKEKGKRVIFVSNKTTGSINDYRNFLSAKGINTEENEIINSTIITANYLKKKHYAETFFALGENAFINEISKAGLKFSDNPDNINIVLVTLDRTLDYHKLEIAARALDKGARFYAANIDDTCPIDGGEILDAGSTISALEVRTNRKLEKYFGKPSQYIVKEILYRLELEKERCLIVGDRMETDMEMGFKFGIDTALVMTGVLKHIKPNGKKQPTYKFSSVADLI